MAGAFNKNIITELDNFMKIRSLPGLKNFNF